MNRSGCSLDEIALTCSYITNLFSIMSLLQPAKSKFYQNVRYSLCHSELLLHKTEGTGEDPVSYLNTWIIRTWCLCHAKIWVYQHQQFFFNWKFTTHLQLLSPSSLLPSWDHATYSGCKSSAPCPDTFPPGERWPPARTASLALARFPQISHN